jgi:tetratricopeptide (TPR) repeat protein
MRNHLAVLTLLALPTLPMQAQAAAPQVARSAAQAGAQESLAAGRKALAEGRFDEALAAFEQAAAADGGAPLTRMWVGRAMSALGRHDDALALADELRKLGLPGGDADYLFGHALLGFTKASLASGGNAFTQGQFLDAAGALKRALAHNPKDYADAWLPLAECAWYGQDLPGARTAAAKATELEPRSSAAHALLGRVAMSQYAAASDEAEKQAHWSAARTAFETAVRIEGEPTETWKRGALAEWHVQLGHLQGFAADKAKASEHYATAIGWEPSRVDFGVLRNVLGNELAQPCLLEGEKRFLQRYSETDALYATLSWWLGYGHFEAAQWPECERAYRRAVALWPGYANSWYYVFRACSSQQKREEALTALRAYDEIAPEGLIESLAGQKAYSLPALEHLVGWCADPGKHNGRARNLDAAYLSEVLTRLEPQTSRFWNNLGLFVRDHGDALRWARSAEATPEKLDELWKRALVAYEKALALEPENPNYLNDTAVMLHYYLKRDYDKALSMYERAAVLADQILARKDLDPDTREVVKIAQRDSKNNTVKIKRLMEKLARGEKPDQSDENN